MHEIARSGPSDAWIEPSRLATMDSSQEGAMDEYRQHLYDALQTASRDYDQAILTLTAATLAVSVTFAHDITPTPKDGTTAVLLAAWGVLVASMISIVASFLTSQWLLRQRIADLDRPAGKPPMKDGWSAQATGILNIIAGGALVLGLVLLAWYAIANV